MSEKKFPPLPNTDHESEAMQAARGKYAGILQQIKELEERHQQARLTLETSVKVELIRDARREAADCMEVLPRLEQMAYQAGIEYCRTARHGLREFQKEQRAARDRLVHDMAKACTALAGGNVEEIERLLSCAATEGDKFGPGNGPFPEIVALRNSIHCAECDVSIVADWLRVFRKKLADTKTTARQAA